MKLATPEPLPTDAQAEYLAYLVRCAARSALRNATVRAKGAAARAAGLGPEACPYRDIRQASGKLTYSRHWRKTWFEGYGRT